MRINIDFRASTLLKNPNRIPVDSKSGRVLLSALLGNGIKYFGRYCLAIIMTRSQVSLSLTIMIINFQTFCHHTVQS